MFQIFEIRGKRFEYSNNIRAEKLTNLNPNIRDSIKKNLNPNPNNSFISEIHKFRKSVTDRHITNNVDTRDPIGSKN